MTVKSKIHIFGLVPLHLNTCIELEAILVINGKKKVGVRGHESCKIKCSSLTMYKECNTTSSVSNRFLTASKLEQHEQCQYQDDCWGLHDVCKI